MGVLIKNKNAKKYSDLIIRFTDTDQQLKISCVESEWPEEDYKSPWASFVDWYKSGEQKAFTFNLIAQTAELDRDSIRSYEIKMVEL